MPIFQIGEPYNLLRSTDAAAVKKKPTKQEKHTTADVVSNPYICYFFRTVNNQTTNNPNFCLSG